MAVNLSPIGGVAAQFFDNSGNILSGGKIYTYTAGTTTPQTTYTSSSGATAHANPIILDAAGRVPGGEIWLTDGLQYKFLIKTSTDVQIGSYDNISGINSNIVNYTTSQEIQTATAGQTVFTLTTMQYQPGTNSLSVFVDGVNQYGPGALYAYQETSATVVTFTTGLHVGAEVKFTTSVINASSYGNAEQISYTPPFANSVATNVEAKLAQTVSVIDFGADPTGVADSTAAFTAAQGTGNIIVFIPPGTYKLDNLRLKNGARFIGSGYEATIINQGSAGNPAINCTSDVTTGQLSSVEFSGFKVVGHLSATVAAVLVAAAGVWAVWKSTFDFVGSNTYRVLEVQAATANNVFRCDFKVTSQDHSNIACVINGGVYNTFDLFLTNCQSGYAVDFLGTVCTFTKCVADAQLKFAGATNVIAAAAVEGWGLNGSGASISASTYPAALVDLGTNNVYINSLVDFTSVASPNAKVLYAVLPFNGTTYAGLTIFGNGLLNPVGATNAYPFTIINASSDCVNKMETVFASFSDVLQNLRRCTFIGTCSTITGGNAPQKAGKTIQYLAPTATFNFQVLGNTDVVVWEPTGVIAQCNLVLPVYPLDNQTLTFSSTQTVTLLSISTAYAPSDNITLVPTTLAANTSFTIVYRAANTKWYKI